MIMMIIKALSQQPTNKLQDQHKHGKPPKTYAKKKKGKETITA
jgi:hypothetical protein